VDPWALDALNAAAIRPILPVKVAGISPTTRRFHRAVPKREESPMKKLAIAAAAVFVAMSGIAHAADASCKATATEKKLAGAALNSFMTKCEKDAAAKCDTAAADKKLAGAAKTSFTKKCVGDAIGQ